MMIHTFSNYKNKLDQKDKKLDNIQFNLKQPSHMLLRLSLPCISTQEIRSNILFQSGSKYKLCISDHKEFRYRGPNLIHSQFHRVPPFNLYQEHSETPIYEIVSQVKEHTTH